MNEYRTSLEEFLCGRLIRSESVFSPYQAFSISGFTKEYFTKRLGLLDCGQQGTITALKIYSIIAVLREVPPNRVDIYVIFQRLRMHVANAAGAEHKVCVKQLPALFVFRE